MNWFVLNVASKTEKDLTKHGNLKNILTKGVKQTKKYTWSSDSDTFSNWCEFEADVKDREHQLIELLCKYDGSSEQQKLLKCYQDTLLKPWKNKASNTLLGKLALWIYCVKRNKREWFVTLFYDLVIRPVDPTDERVMLGDMYKVLWTLLIDISSNSPEQALVLKTNFEVWKGLKKEKLRLMLFYYSCCMFFQECSYKGIINDDDLDLSLDMFW